MAQNARVLTLLTMLTSASSVQAHCPALKAGPVVFPPSAPAVELVSVTDRECKLKLAFFRPGRYGPLHLRQLAIASQPGNGELTVTDGILVYRHTKAGAEDSFALTLADGQTSYPTKIVLTSH